MSKTHYRKILKSDHLGCADLEDYIENQSDMVFTIQRVQQQLGAKVAGKKIDANIMYFENKDGKKVKPLVINATNGKTMSKMANSGFVEDWAGISIKLYIDANVSMMGERTGGVRIHPKAVVMEKQLLTRENVKVWNNVIVAYKKYGNFDAVLNKWNMTQEDMQFIVDGVASGNL